MRRPGTLYVATGDSHSDPPADTSDAIVALDLKTGAVIRAEASRRQTSVAHTTALV
jgi:hypothetical protein